MSTIIYWFKPRIAYLLLLYFVKLSEWTMVKKPTINSARYYLYMNETNFNLDPILDVWAIGYNYPKIYKIRQKYDAIYELLNQVERYGIQFPPK